jgi:hypothetical protein
VAPEAELDCVTIDYPDRGFAVVLSEVVSFHADAAGDGLELASLDRLLGGEAPVVARAAHVIIVRRDEGGQLGFRTRGAVRLQRAPERALFRLPGVLRDAGCQPWVHGVLAGDRVGGAVEPLRIWISLRYLARSVERAA